MDIDLSKEKKKLEGQIRSYINRNLPVPPKLLDQYSTVLSITNVQGVITTDNG